MPYPVGNGKGGHGNAEIEEEPPDKIPGLQPDQKICVEQGNEGKKYNKARAHKIDNIAWSEG